MGNQNLEFLYSAKVESQRNQDKRFALNVRNTNTVGGNTTGGLTVLPERTEIHAWTLQQYIFDAQVNNLHLEFLTNGITYFDYTHVANSSAIVDFDFSVISSNTLISPDGDFPLIMEKGETIGFKIEDGNRLNNSDRWGFTMSVWGIRLPA
jgi:hypothetical protein